MLQSVSYIASEGGIISRKSRFLTLIDTMKSLKVFSTVVADTVPVLSTVKQREAELCVNRILSKAQ